MCVCVCARVCVCVCVCVAGAGAIRRLRGVRCLYTCTKENLKGSALPLGGKWAESKERKDRADMSAGSSSISLVWLGTGTGTDPVPASNDHFKVV